jgi:hypothetical protein
MKPHRRVTQPMISWMLLLSTGLAIAPCARGQDFAGYGVWELDASRSTAPETPSPYRRTRLTIEPWEDGVQVSYDMIGVRGGHDHLEWRGQFDGTDTMVQGLNYVLTNAYTLEDDRTWEIVVKLDGEWVATTRVEISADGQTMEAVTEEAGPDGSRLATTSVYRRR